MFNRRACSFVSSAAALLALLACIALQTPSLVYAEDGEPDFLVLNPKGE